MNTSSTPLRIDIISDVMCPWCIIGYRQLAQALKETGTPHEIHWHPFELNPNMPVEGQDLFEHITEKYGSTRAQSEENRNRLVALGADLGFEFKFDEASRVYNTFNTHQLLHWADEQDRKNDLKQALFTAHFTHARNLADIEVLADIADEIDLDRNEAIAVLKDQRFAQTVRDTEEFWVKQGIQGVPAAVFDRQHLVTGAQGVENYTNILLQLVNKEA